VKKSLTFAPNRIISLSLLVFLLASGTMAVESARELALSRAWLQRNTLALADIRDSAVSIRDAESGQRGYLLTGDPTYLRPYLTAVPRIAAYLAALQTLFGDNAAQQSRLAALRPLITAKIAEMAETLQLKQQSGTGAAMALVRTNQGQALMASIEAELTAMTLLERQLLAGRLEDSNNAMRVVSAMALLATALATIAIYCGIRRLNIVAATDRLTGLLNRNRIWDLYNHGLLQGKTGVTAIIYVNLDRFRSANMMFGLKAGDTLLIEVARRLRSLGGEVAIGRRGADDFVFCCYDMSCGAAEALGRAAVVILALPFEFGAHSMHLTASVGVSHADTAGDVDLRQAADDAIWVAKAEGGNICVSFLPSMLAERRDLAELEEDLRHAIDSQTELSLAYQPVVWIAGRQVGAVEVLARWAHPRLGQIPPSRFIPLAETRGLIVPLGRKLMQLAVSQAQLWRERGLKPNMLTNINISPLQFASGDVIAEFAAMLVAADLRPQDFCIEVTEGAFTNAQAIAGLQEARRIGFYVTMDDFGVGYSCLAQLPRLPLVSVKLDRSFILGAEQDLGEAVMLASIVQLAHAQNLTVIAEGIETETQFALVADSGCDAIQGYFYAHPMPAAALEQWLAAWPPLAPALPEPLARFGMRRQD